MNPIPFFRALVIAFFLVISSSANAITTLNFGDTAAHWPGWLSPTSSENSTDVIGIPNLTGGYIKLGDQNQILEIGITYNGSSSSLSRLLVPGDIFLNVGNDTTWDYVIDNPEGADGANGGAVQWYANINTPLSSPTAYHLSNQTPRRDGGNWSGYNIRDNHPTGLKTYSGLTSGGTAQASAWVDVSGPHTFVINSFSSFIYLPSDTALTIGFAMNCANDVIYETVHTPVPEPSSLLLLSSGLLGFGRVVRRRKAKRG